MMIKTPAEIEKMRIAGRLTAKVLEALTPFIRPGITTMDIDRFCEDFIVQTLKAIPGSKGQYGYPYSVNTSLNHVVCHGMPSDKQLLKSGDIINVDVTVIHDGYYGDSSKMFCIGTVPTHAQRLVDVTQECLYRGILAVKPKATLGDIGYAIASHARANHYSVVRDYCGHGIGKKMHEEPQVVHFGAAGTGMALQPGMIFTIEPMINQGTADLKHIERDGWPIAVTKDRKLSAQWEHTILVTETGFEVLTLREEEKRGGIVLNKRILIINTGGTISSVKTAKGYEPMPDYVQTTLAKNPAMVHEDMPAYVIKEYQPLLDSSNMTLNDWNRIARDIADHYDKFDGFVVLHGTDTMAYTASALSFMLENLGKPVILTGSQIPLSEVRNDALDNIVTSLWLCAHEALHEVCIYFNQKLLRGNRTQKVSAAMFNAFDSPNYPHLASIGIDIQLAKEYLLPKPKAAFHLQPLVAHFIANFRLFPGFVTEVLADLLQQPLRGLILETYGSGNAQNDDPRFLAILKKACDEGMIIVNCTQCQQGPVEMSHYATGYTLKQAGLISGRDMTPEAAHCKLLYLLTKYSDIAQIKKQMETNLCGEFSA